MVPSPGSARLYRWERAWLALFGLLVVGFGVFTEIRSAFQSSRKTDVGVYLRAAWAVRTGADVFAVTDNNGWHYCYPPALAIALVPLADPLPWESHAGYVPYSISVAVWYVLSVALLFWACHILAKVVLPDDEPGSRRWWYARTIPLYVCVGGIGHSLGRGQVNLLILALIAAAFVATARGRRFTSGVWLAAAAVVKVIPAFLVLFPLVRRDGRSLAGFAAGSVVLLGVVPALVWGIDGAIDSNRKVLELVVKPGTTGGGDQTRAKELTDATSTDSQSFLAVIHAATHPDPATRPETASRETRLLHWGAGSLLTLITIGVGWFVMRPNPLTPFPGKEGGTGFPPSPFRGGDGGGVANSLVFLGCLCAVMLMASPVSHMHYYAFALPLVAGVWLRSLAHRPGHVLADRWTTAVLIAWGLSTALPLFPGPIFDRLRENGFGVLATVGLWAFGVGTIWRTRTVIETAEEPGVLTQPHSNAA